MAVYAPQYVLLGRLAREYLLPPVGPNRLDEPGGNLLYATAGLALWERSLGLVARVGEDYPQEWLDRFNRMGFNTKGVRVLPRSLDLRSFIAYTDGYTRHEDNPVAHFARRGLPFPRSLLNYRLPDSRLDSLSALTPGSLRQVDLPTEFLHATIAHFCPLDFLTHSLMPAVLRQAGFTTLTLDPGPRYMDPIFWKNLPSILTGLTAFLASEEELRALFQGRSTDLWEMAEALAAYGCQIVVVKRGEQGQLVYDAAGKSRFEIPAYPARVRDPTGAGDAYCGGFLAGFVRTLEPLQAGLFGNVSASLTIEGSGPFYALDVLPGLPEARLEVLQQSYRKI